MAEISPITVNRGEDMTEKEIRQRIEKSEKDGFKELFRTYRSYVYSVVWRKIRFAGTKEDAEECLSDIFAQVFLHFGEIEEGKLTTYISMISGRMAVDRYRSLTAKKNIKAEDDSVLEFVSSGDDIQSGSENAEINRILYERIMELGEPDSTIVIHRYYYERTSAEIAGQLNLTASNVRMRLSRALKQLRKTVAEEGTY